MAARLSEQIKDTLDGTRGRLGGHLSLAAGILAGVVGLVISFALKGLMPARPLGDPLPLMLGVTGITRGFIYLPWRPALIHLIFALLLGIFSVVVLTILSPESPGRNEAKFAGRIAALINVGLVAILSVDAIIVGLWYVLSGLVSILITGFVAGLIADGRPLKTDH